MLSLTVYTVHELLTNDDNNNINSNNNNDDKKGTRIRTEHDKGDGLN